MLDLEHGLLPEQRFLLACGPGTTRSVERGQHPHPARAGRVERSALHERLERSLVRGSRIDSLAEVPDRGERPALVARADDRARRRARPRSRGRMIAPAAGSPTFFTAESPKRIFPSTTAKSSWDVFTSGGS